MRDYRCRKCGRLLFRSDAPRGRVQAICPDRRCRTAQVVDFGGREVMETTIERTAERRTEDARLTLVPA